MGFLIALGALLMTLGVGVWVSSLLSGERRLTRTVEADSQRRRPQVGSDGPAFVPLQLGVEVLRWPSEMPRRTSLIPDVPWPSESWDDPYFGKNRGPGQPIHIGDALPGDAAEVGRRDPTPAVPSPGRTEKKKQKKKQQQQQQAAPDDVADAFFTGAANVADALNPEEIRALVAQVGLAGAVEEIRKRTGMEFREAANLLAKALRN